jgi:hypothetical protein
MGSDPQHIFRHLVLLPLGSDTVRIFQLYGSPELAERRGFEPRKQLPIYTLSRRAPSTTRTSLLGTPERIRTSGPLFRKQMLYPAELRVHIVGILTSFVRGGETGIRTLGTLADTTD